MMDNNKLSKEVIYQLVLQIIRLIPKGRVTSYGAIGVAVGLKSGARQVARAISELHEAHHTMPAHRVVSSAGKLTGPHNTRKKLLLSEGVQIDGDKIVSFNDIFWNPAEEVTF